MAKNAANLYNRLRDAVDGKLDISDMEKLLVDFAEPHIEKMQKEINANPDQIRKYLYGVIRRLETRERSQYKGGPKEHAILTL